MTSSIKKISCLMATAATLVALTGCADDGDDPEPATHTAPNGDAFNDADVEFATAMIPHHAQALAMVDLTRGRRLEPEVRRLADNIQLAQGPEIELMTDWLTAWGEPVPDTVRDHAHAHMDDMEMDSEMPGMMSGHDMAELEAAEGSEFQQLWLEMMIEHHQGAIEMADEEQEDGLFRPAVDLAGSIEESQQSEIDHMEELLTQELPEDAAMGHVHGLGVDPADGTLYAATHFGLFRIDDDSAVRVADRWQDTMAFTVVGGRHFLASGHPDLREDLPDHLGLIETTDAGESWQPLALHGEADFHALEPAGAGIYAFDALSGRLLWSADRRDFRTVAELSAYDLAIDQREPDRVLVTTPTAELLSVERATGRSQRVPAPAVVFVDWHSLDLLVGLGPDGTVQVSRDGAETWQAAGRLPGPPAALEVTEDAWYAASGDGVFASDDAGKTWEAVVTATG